MRNRLASASRCWGPATRVEKGGTQGDAMRRFLTRIWPVLFAAALNFLAAPAGAQNYPSGPVKLVVPVPAGGVTDTMARILAQRLAEFWGESVIVDNRPGGNYGI